LLSWKFASRACTAGGANGTERLDLATYKSMRGLKTSRYATLMMVSLVKAEEDEAKCV
jgi:hypothetical protein